MLLNWVLGSSSSCDDGTGTAEVMAPSTISDGSAATTAPSPPPAVAGTFPCSCNVARRGKKRLSAAAAESACNPIADEKSHQVQSGVIRRNQAHLQSDLSDSIVAQPELLQARAPTTLGG